MRKAICTYSKPKGCSVDGTAGKVKVSIIGLFVPRTFRTAHTMCCRPMRSAVLHSIVSVRYILNNLSKLRL